VDNFGYKDIISSFFEKIDGKYSHFSNKRSCYVLLDKLFYIYFSIFKPIQKRFF